MFTKAIRRWHDEDTDLAAAVTTAEQMAAADANRAHYAATVAADQIQTATTALQHAGAQLARSG